MKMIDLKSINAFYSLLEDDLKIKEVFMTGRDSSQARFKCKRFRRITKNEIIQIALVKPFPEDIVIIVRFPIFNFIIQKVII